MTGLAAHIIDQLHPQPSPDWLAALRGQLSAELRELALPTRREENWRYCSLAQLESRPFAVTLRQTHALTAAELADLTPPVDCHRVVFVNGHFAPDLSVIDELPNGVRFTNLAGASVDVMDGLQPLLERRLGEGSDALMANLNTAALGDGLVLEIGKGVRVKRPIHCLWLTLAGAQPLVCSVRNVVRVGAGASACLLEHFADLGGADFLTNVVSQLELAEQAEFNHIRLQQESDRANLITRQEARLQARSQYRYFGFDLGGALVRHDLNAALLGEGARCQLSGAYALDGERLVDNHSRVEHIAPNASSSAFFRGVLDGRSRAVFNGKVIVRAGADGTDATQTNNNLLLSRLAEADTKPELEIYADDVQCTHGATVGQLDPQQLFYLRSRGIAEAEARQLLSYAFCREVVDKLDDAQLREFVAARLVEHLPRAEALEDVA